jgi:hypothetical protein
VRRSAHGSRDTRKLSPGRVRTTVSCSWRTATFVTGATTALALLMPAAVGDAAPAPTLSSLVAQAKQLTYQINALSEQYDGLRVQLSSAKTAAAGWPRPATRTRATTPPCRSSARPTRTST